MFVFKTVYLTVCLHFIAHLSVMNFGTFNCCKAAHAEVEIDFHHSLIHTMKSVLMCLLKFFKANDIESKM